MVRRKLPYKRSNESVAYENAVRKGLRSLHVLPSDGGWKVKKPLATKGRNFDNKDQAVNYARSRVKESNTRLIVHNRDGRIASH